jgi:hypothetical protein
MITCGEGKYRVWLKEERLGDDLVLTLGGGERSHVGAVVVKVPGQEMRVVKLEGHYDYVVLEPIAEAAARKYDCTVVVLGGIHINNASKSEIEILVTNCKELMKCI